MSGVCQSTDVRTSTFAYDVSSVKFCNPDMGADPNVATVRYRTNGSETSGWRHLDANSVLRDKVPPLSSPQATDSSKAQACEAMSS
nr:hypothetical protein CFP56_31498 [Quercus suber]